MKFGSREICNVVMKAKNTQKIGNKVFYAGEPVCYFDTLKTSTFEGSSSTVYATGGRGNARLMSWDGDKAVTFTMEDALISAEGLMILTGAGIIEPGGDNNTASIKQHITEQTNKTALIADDGGFKVYVSKKPFNSLDKGIEPVYVMVLDAQGEIISEPCLASAIGASAEASGDFKGLYAITISDRTSVAGSTDYVLDTDGAWYPTADGFTVIVDYYFERSTNVKQIEITADSFSGNFYLEAETLFRTMSGEDLPAEFVIPNCRVQSNFSFNMSGTGDPSTFTFTMDAFPDYTKFDTTKKVLADIQIIEESAAENGEYRTGTDHTNAPANG